MSHHTPCFSDEGAAPSSPLQKQTIASTPLDVQIRADCIHQSRCLGYNATYIAFLRASLASYPNTHFTQDVQFIHARGLLYRTQPHSCQLHHPHSPWEYSIYENIDSHKAPIEECDIDTNILASLITSRRNQH
jgi:hypothetical protein